MINYTERKFSTAIDKIQNCRDHNIDWEEIKYARKGSEEGLKVYLADELFGEVTLEEWYDLVKYEKQVWDGGKDIKGGSVVIGSKGKGSVPKLDGSAWQQYKAGLSKNINADDIQNIEDSVATLLGNMKNVTEPGKPNKGMVIGSVQSGKTANIAGLIAMSADEGFNFFVLFPGVLTNLEAQNSKRLSKDLNLNNSNLFFYPIVKLNQQALSNLNVQPSDKFRYYYITLKNPSQISRLNKWLSRDNPVNGGIKSHIKMLIIDDEADQAGINTRDMKKDENERTATNRQLINLMYDKDIKGLDNKTHFASVNYIGFTATPYANLLNEKPENDTHPESMFPNDFVCSLPDSHAYFGPAQIFGSDEKPGMNIINEIPVEESDLLYSQRKTGAYNSLPTTLLDSLYWFYCCVGCVRYWETKPGTTYERKFKPVSMLINLDYLVGTHEALATKLVEYLKGVKKADFINACKDSFGKQTSMLPMEDFFQDYPHYSGKNMQEYPTFEEILPFIEAAFVNPPEPIRVEDEKFVYSRGVNICVDNGDHNGLDEDNNLYRLRYPEDTETLDYSPAFIVIGGQTLSRGLTIEGLMSTYFDRRVLLGDTLMQMGRWFGYRHGYELLPRIWMTAVNEDKYAYLAKIDIQLKKEMKELSDADKSPKDCGVRILSSPFPKWMRVTAKNRMQNSIVVNVDCSGSRFQTTDFYGDEEKQKANLAALIGFVSALDKIDANPKPFSNEYPNIVWKNIPYEQIFSFIRTYQCPNNDSFVPDMDQLEGWVKKRTEKNKLDNWNVILAGISNTDGKTPVYEGIPNHTITKINRAKLRPDTINGTLRLKAIRAPHDLYADVDPKYWENKKEIKDDDIVKLRAEAGLGQTPALIIYVIDKDSKPVAKNSLQRIPLDAKQNLVGLSFNIPKPEDLSECEEALTIDLTNENKQLEDISNGKI